jgi:hypothetical protein
MNPANRLSWGEYILPGQGESTAEARWQFAQIVRRILPRFFEELREKVLPKYARLVRDHGPDYWEHGLDVRNLAVVFRPR